MARPTKLTPELMAGIVRLVENAVHPIVAAQSLGVSKGVYYEWLARGRETHPTRPAEPIYQEFADAIEHAEARAESALVALALSKVKTPEGAILVLERRFRERWRKSDEVNVNIRALVARLTDAGMDPDQIMAEAEAMLVTSGE